MRIVAISDTHNQQSRVELPDGDVLVHAGDFTGGGTEMEFKNVARWLESLKDKFKYRIIIAGNHDFGLQDNKKIITEMFDKDLIYLDHQSVTIKGINFFGSPYTPLFNNWAFMKDEYVLSALFKQIPDNTNILITHGPPNMILDKTIRGDNVGSLALYDRIKELKQLNHHIFGHIHEAYGEENIDNIRFHNVSIANEYYRLVNKPIIIEA